jgi:integrase
MAFTQQVQAPGRMTLRPVDPGVALPPLKSVRLLDRLRERIRLVVREGKGGKDRVVMLPDALVAELRDQLGTRWPTSATPSNGISRTRPGRDRSRSRCLNRRGRGSDRLGRAGCATVCLGRHDGLPCSQSLKCWGSTTVDAMVPIDARESGRIKC